LTASVIDGRFCACGGEYQLRRRREYPWLVTYLLCPFCGAKRETMRYHLETTELVAQPKPESV
jgi:hypothetical protein